MHISQRASVFCHLFRNPHAFACRRHCDSGHRDGNSTAIFFYEHRCLELQTGESLVRQSHGRRLERALRQAVEYRYVKYHDFVRECYWRRVQLKLSELPNHILSWELSTITGDLRAADPRS